MNAITAPALTSPNTVRVTARVLQGTRRTFFTHGFTNAVRRVKVNEPIRPSTADEYRDLGDAFAEFADESLEWATATFEATVETWPSE